MRGALTWVVVLSMALVLVACSPRGSVEQEAVRATILRYNELLTQGYRSFNMNPMREVATQLQSEDEYIHMSSLAEGGIRLDPELKDIKFTKVSIETTTARAETRETWDYRHYARADGTLVLEEKGLIYNLAWDLEKQPDGRWLVADVRAISATSTVKPTISGTITPVPSSDDSGPARTP